MSKSLKVTLLVLLLIFLLILLPFIPHSIITFLGVCSYIGILVKIILEINKALG